MILEVEVIILLADFHIWPTSPWVTFLFYYFPFSKVNLQPNVLCCIDYPWKHFIMRFVTVLFPAAAPLAIKKRFLGHDRSQHISYLA